MRDDGKFFQESKVQLWEKFFLQASFKNGKIVEGFETEEELREEFFGRQKCRIRCVGKEGFIPKGNFDSDFKIFGQRIFRLYVGGHRCRWTEKKQNL